MMTRLRSEPRAPVSSHCVHGRIHAQVFAVAATWRQENNYYNILSQAYLTLSFLGQRCLHERERGMKCM